ncbi:SET and MYND domain-containing protein 4-like [Cloeon dipterum]|uniref:SET and MYND domain-containing protein 4-like n=1 Tax=Cloeon dipterum TaxID=197152 RepID=UPI003220343A
MDRMEHWKRQGSSFYSKGELVEAAAAYARCIALSSPGNRERALALANRSAVLVVMGRYEESASDAERALQADYPDVLRFRLHLKRALCFREMAQMSRAEDELRRAKDMVNSHIPEEKIGNITELLEKSYVGPVDIKSFPFEVEYCPSPQLAKGGNIDCPGFSALVRVETDGFYGRKVVAAQDISPGEVILVEEPVVSSLKNDSEWTHCAQCYKFCLSLMPCETCRKISFCSDECKSASTAGVHSMANCTAMSRFNSDLQTVMNLSETIFSTFSRIIDLISSFGIDTLIAFDPEKDSKSLLGRLLDLCFHRVEQEEQLKRACAFVIRHCYQLDDEQVIQKLADLSYRVILIDKANSYSIEEPIFDSRSAEFEIKIIAYGTYPSASLMNHSCDPNVVSSFHRKTMVIRAVRPIAKGEQVFNRYCNSFYNMPKDVRQNRLGMYSFKCACEACTKDWPPAKMLPDEPKFLLAEKTRPLLDKFQGVLSKSRSANGVGVNYELLRKDDTFRCCVDLQQLYFEPQRWSRLDKTYRAVELLLYYHFCAKTRNFVMRPV